MIVEQLRKFNSTKTLPTASSERVFFGICGASFPAFIIRWPPPPINQQRRPFSPKGTARDSITGVDDSCKRVKSPISDRAEPQPMQ